MKLQRKILFLDDSIIFARTMEDQLLRSGFTSFRFCSCYENALVTAIEYQPHIICIDLVWLDSEKHPRDEDGEDLLMTFRNHKQSGGQFTFADTRICMLTGNLSRAEAEDLGGKWSGVNLFYKTGLAADLISQLTAAGFL